MTVYNGLPYIRQAIDSVLNQSHRDFEFLIIKDCSTDETRDLILSYDDPRIRLVDNEENIKQTRSLNKGLRLASGEIIARLDADDVCHPRRLEMQVDYLRKNPDVAVVGSSFRWIDESGKVTGRCWRPESDLALRWMQFFECPIGCGAAAFRKSVIWNELGGFDESITVPQDWELWSRVLQAHRVGSIRHFLMDIRRHSNCETLTSGGRKIEEARLITRMNPKRILGIEDESEYWLQKLDSLREKPVEHPEKRIKVIGVLFARFCALHPVANHDPDVLRVLLVHYARTLIHTRPTMLGPALRCLKARWPASLRGVSAGYYLMKSIALAVQWKLRK